MNRFFLIGYMGCGKTTSGLFAASGSGLAFVDMDSYIEEKHHKTVAEIFAEQGQDKFRKLEHDTLIELSARDNVIIATGGGAPCFFNNMELMNASGSTIYIRMTAEHLTYRLESVNGGGRPLIAGKRGDELLQFIRSGLEQRETFYLRAQNIVEGSDEEIANILLTKIRSLLK